VEGNGLSFLTGGTVVRNFKSLRSIVPDVDLAVGGCHDKLLAQADIHPRDRRGVECSMQRLHFKHFRRHITIIAELDRLQLVVPIDRIDLVFGLG